LLDVRHGPFDIGDFTQLVGVSSSAIYLAIYVIGQSCVIAFDACRAKAFQSMEKVLELEENLRRCITLKPQPTQMLQLTQNIYQAGVKGGIKQRKVIVQKFGHVKKSQTAFSIIWIFFAETAYSLAFWQI
jgi:hypothetical protein